MREAPRYRVKIRYGIQQDVAVWEWLVDNIPIDRMHVEGTDLAGSGWHRETRVEFASELDARKFLNWACPGDFEVLESESLPN